MKKKEDIGTRLTSILDGLEKVRVEERAEIGAHPLFPERIERAELEKLTIRNKGGHYQLFILNEEQIRILGEINDALDARKPVREILLKDRKFGGSTLYCGVCYLLLRDYNYKMTIVGHELPAAKNLYKIIRLFLKKDKSFKEKPDANNAREMIFSGGGECWVASADREDTSRSQTNQIVLATEVPMYPNCKEQMLALLNTVSKAYGTFVFIESTAKGIGNWFHKHWKEAENEKHKDWNGYRAIFVGWQDHKEYREPFNSGEERTKFIEEMAEEETQLFEEGYELEQLNWRRMCIKSQCGNDVETFHQEYPGNPQEAFLESGRPVFNQHRLASWFEEAIQFHPPAFEGEVNFLAKVDWTEAAHSEIEKAKAFRKQHGGKLRVWEWPQEFDEHKRVFNYGIGMDVAEGKERKDGKGDDSTIFIGKAIWSEDHRILEEAKIVLTWCGKIPPDTLGILGTKLGVFYNYGHICPEANSMGGTTIKVLWERYRKHRLYRRRGMDHIFDEKTRDSVGFYSDLRSKPALIVQLATFIRENRIVLYDLDTITELSEITNEKGKIETNGRDRTIALALCLEACIRDTKNTKEEKEQSVYDINTTWKKQIREEAAMDRRCYAALTGR